MDSSLEKQPIFASGSAKSSSATAVGASPVQSVLNLVKVLWDHHTLACPRTPQCLSLMRRRLLARRLVGLLPCVPTDSTIPLADCASAASEHAMLAANDFITK